MRLVERLRRFAPFLRPTASEPDVSPDDTSANPDLEVHHIEISARPGGYEVVTYISGCVVPEPTVIASTSTVTIPDNAVLVEHECGRQYSTIGGERYPISTYRIVQETAVPPTVDSKQVPPNLRGARVQRQDLNPDSLSALATGRP
jgi:hypothetical protein